MKETDKKKYLILAQDFDLLINEPMDKYTSFKVGGPADLLAMPETRIQLKDLLEKASGLGIPVTIVGGGTNLLVKDRGIRGLVVNMSNLRSKVVLNQKDDDEQIISAGSGHRLSEVCWFAVNHSLSGLEFAAGIPGTIGGAVIMNAGTKSRDMSSLVESIDVLTQKSFTFQTIESKELDFTYRQLNLADIIVGVKLKLQKKEPEKIKKEFQTNLRSKKTAQPVSLASAGCFFKNPDQKKSAGELIEKSGLKGMRINDAMISEHHANYIVNTCNATCKDILLLKEHIQKTVLQKYNIKLETEVRIEGE